MSRSDFNWGVNNVTENLKKKSVGVGKIDDGIFIPNSEWMSTVLKHIFNAIKLTFKLPSERLRGIVTFILKTDKYSINNYNPINITDVVYKFGIP